MKASLYEARCLLEQSMDPKDLEHRVDGLRKAGLPET
jgi:hypothetical protein